MESTDLINWDEFQRVDMRVGRIVAVYPFPEARKPAYRLTVDFGRHLGLKKCSAQVTNYVPDELEGRQVVAVVNLPPKQIGPFISDILVLGAIDVDGRVHLLQPDQDSELGSKVA